MLALLQANLPTVLIIVGLILFFGLLLYSLIRDKKKGKSSCCGGCAGCAMAGKCHPEACAPHPAESASASADSNTPNRHSSTNE